MKSVQKHFYLLITPRRKYPNTFRWSSPRNKRLLSHPHSQTNWLLMVDPFKSKFLTKNPNKKKDLIISKFTEFCPRDKTPRAVSHIE